MLQHWDHRFEVDWTDLAWSNQGLWSSDSRVLVLPDCEHREGAIVVADGEWQDFDVIAALFPHVPQSTENRLSTASLSIKLAEACVFTLHPWLEGFLKSGQIKQCDAKGKRAGELGGHAANHDRALGNPHQDVVESEALMDALLSKRRDLGLEASAGGSAFGVVLRGGPDLFRRTGKMYDELRGQACHATAEHFLVEWGLKKSFSASLNLYGEAAAQTLAESWVSKLQWCYDMVESQGPTFSFSVDVLKEWAEPPALQTLWVEGNQATRARISHIRSLCPKRV